MPLWLKIALVWLVTIIVVAWYWSRLKRPFTALPRTVSGRDGWMSINGADPFPVKSWTVEAQWRDEEADCTQELPYVTPPRRPRPVETPFHVPGTTEAEIIENLRRMA